MPDCDDPELEISAGSECETDTVTIDTSTPLDVNVVGGNVDISVGDVELDVAGGGTTSVTRCLADGSGTIDVVYFVDENHADVPPTSDDGVLDARIVGWVAADDATIQSAATIPALGPCVEQPVVTIGDPTCVLIDGVPAMARPKHTTSSTGTVTTWLDPLTGDPITGSVTLPTPVTI